MELMTSGLGICNGAILLATCVVSVMGFSNPVVEERLIFEPERILAYKEYYRLVTSAFLHADFWHLLLNMMSLYFFGPSVEAFLGWYNFLLIYFGAIVGGGLLALYVHRHHEYRAYGASGGVCGMIFAYILLFPGTRLYSFPLPFPVPAWLYAAGFLLGSFYALKAGKDNVGHDAHLGGAIVGLLLAACIFPASVQYNLRLFLLVLGISVAVLVYLWVNPLFLATRHFVGPVRWRRREQSAMRSRREPVEVDALLEKISKSGFESLTEEEKSRLQQVSDKFRSRSESKKPESGLAI
jgi:membrane associated rhomboid family serine protease